jgi:multicomponent Na+:H+ antiporter subunit F
MTVPLFLVIPAGIAGATYLLLLLATFIAFGRLVHGPSLADRVIALDLIAAMMAALVAVTAITRDEAVLIDVALVVALVAFLGTVAFARYLERRGIDERTDY